MQYTLMPVRKAIKQYELMQLLSPEFRKARNAKKFLNSYSQAVIFNGDTELPDDLSIWAFANKSEAKNASPLEATILENRLLIFCGNLKCHALDTMYLSGVFVLGDVTCAAVKLGYVPLYVKGNLVASKGLVANAEDDEVFDGASEGRYWIRVDGEVTAPVIKSWHFGLSHLRYSAGSGKEQVISGPDGATLP